MKWFLIIWVLTPIGPVSAEFEQNSEQACRAAVSTMIHRGRFRRDKHAVIYACRQHKPAIIKPELIET